MSAHDTGLFFRAAMRNPKLIGAVAPSSPGLSAQLAAVVPTAHPAVVVELGPGTGAVSTAIAHRLRKGSRHIAIELDPELADRVRDTKPDIEVVTGNAVDLAEILGGLGIDKVDAVVSGLPWSLIPPSDQRRILEAVAGALAPGAAFTTFAYLHALRMKGARRLRALLDAGFDEVIVSRSIWLNTPPALTYVCRRPRNR